MSEKKWSEVDPAVRWILIIGTTACALGLIAAMIISVTT